MKWANAIGKTLLVDVLHTGLPQPSTCKQRSICGAQCSAVCLYTYVSTQPAHVYTQMGPCLVSLYVRVRTYMHVWRENTLRETRVPSRCHLPLVLLTLDTSPLGQFPPLSQDGVGCSGF